MVGRIRVSTATHSAGSITPRRTSSSWPTSRSRAARSRSRIGWSRGRAENQPSERTRTILTAATQFALGCLLSGFCVFYLRSASLWTSWPYLLVLAGIFIGNEFFKVYTTRFTLSLLLYFFALFSYAILVVPVLIAMIGDDAVPRERNRRARDLLVLRRPAWLGSGRERFRQVRVHDPGRHAWRSMRVVNVFYFLKVLPPLPLALADAGVYHSVKKVGTVYQAVDEPQPWTTISGVPPVLHLAPGREALSL